MKHFSVAVWVAAGLTLFALPAFAATHGCMIDSDTMDDLWDLNMATGDSIDMGKVNFDDVDGLSLGADGEVYGVDDTTETYFRIDMNTAETFLIGVGMNNLFGTTGNGDEPGLSSLCDGSMWMTMRNPDNLYRVDTDTGAATLVGPLGAPIVAIAGWKNRLYGISEGTPGNFYEIDADTGAATLIGSLININIADAQGLSFDRRGRLWGNLKDDGSGGSVIFRIDRMTGVATITVDIIDKFGRFQKTGVDALSINFHPGCLPQGDGDGGGGGGCVAATSAYGHVSLAVLALGCAAALIRRRRQ